MKKLLACSKCGSHSFVREAVEKLRHRLVFTVNPIDFDVEDSETLDKEVLSAFYNCADCDSPLETMKAEKLVALLKADGFLTPTER